MFSVPVRTWCTHVVAVGCALATVCALALVVPPVKAYAGTDDQHEHISRGNVHIFKVSSPADITEDSTYSLAMQVNDNGSSRAVQPENAQIDVADSSFETAHATNPAVPAGYTTATPTSPREGVPAFFWDTTNSAYSENMVKVSYTGPQGANVYIYSHDDAGQPQSVFEDGEGYQISAAKGTWLAQNGQANRPLTWVFSHPGTYKFTVKAMASNNGAFSSRTERVYTINVGNNSRTPENGSGGTSSGSSNSSSGDSSESGDSSDSSNSGSSDSSDTEDSEDEDAADSSNEDSSSDSNSSDSNNSNGSENESDHSHSHVGDKDTNEDEHPAEEFTGDVPSERAPEPHPIDPKTGKELLFRTHVDAAHAYWDKNTQKLALGVIDGATLRPASKVAVRLGPDADSKSGREVSRIKLPSSGALRFLGKPGDIVWNAPGQWYPGWHPVWAGVGAGRMPSHVDPLSLNLELRSVEGPGWMSVWRSGANFVAEDLNSANPDKLAMPLTAGGHGHFNWSFPQPGRYKTTWVVTARTKNGQEISSDPYVVDWLVGSDDVVGLPAGTTPADPITTPAESFVDPVGEDDGNIAGSEEGEEPDLPDDKKSYVCLVPGHHDVRAYTTDSGEVMTELKDESGATSVLRKSNSVVIPVPDSASHVLTSDPALAALKVLGPAGTRVWTLPEIQDPSLVWPGLNTEKMNYAKITSAGVKITLSDYEGKGRMVQWDSNVIEGAHRLLDSHDDKRELYFNQPTHRHMAISFNKPGIHWSEYTFYAEFKSHSGWAARDYNYFGTYYAVGDEAIKRACGEDYLTKYPGPQADKPGDKPAPQPTPQPNPGPIPQPNPLPGNGNDANKPRDFKVTLERGHVDLFEFALDPSGKPVLALKEDATGLGVVHNPEDVLLKVSDVSKRTDLPVDIVGASTAWYLPQTQDERMLWPGWDIQGLRAGGYEKARFDVSYTGPEGASIAMWKQSPLSGAQSHLADGGYVLNSAGSTIVQDFLAHTHVNWAFTKPGRYVLKVKGHAIKADGTSDSTPEHTYTIDVGAVSAPSVAARVGQPQGREPSADANGSVVSGGAGVKGMCIPTTITREATEAEARTLSSAQSGRPNTARTTLTFVVGPGARGNASDGHFDLGPAIVGNTVVARIKDDRRQPAQWLDPSQFTFAVGSPAQLTAPSALSFVAPAGKTVWMIPSTQIQGVPWLGMNSQREEIVNGTQGSVTFSLEGVSGPGKFAVFNAGTFGSGVGAHVFNGVGSSYALPLNTHAHQNWVFTEPGTYRVTLSMKVNPRAASLAGSGFGGTSRLVPTGQKGPNGRPMVSEVVGRTADGQECVLSSTGSDTSMVALAAVVLMVLGGLAIAVRKHSLGVVAGDTADTAVEARCAVNSERAQAMRIMHTMTAQRAQSSREVREEGSSLKMISPIHARGARHRAARQVIAAACAVFAVWGLQACSPAQAHDKNGKINVVATTGILADFVREVAGEHANVSQMVPNGADPHSWEPTLRSIRNVTYADMAVTNYLLLEQHSLIRTLDANLPQGAMSVSLAEEAAKTGATILPLVEDRALDTVWLGMRVAGKGEQYGAKRSSQVDLTVTSVDGPGDAAGYLTTTFGAPEIGFASSDGFNASDGFASDTSTLPADAHQHMSWAFTKPGVYKIHFVASVRVSEGARPIRIGEADLICAVGVDAGKVARDMKRHVVSAGHADVTVDLNASAVTLMVDSHSDGSSPLDAEQTPGAAKVLGMASYPLKDVVVDIPPRTLTQVPGQSNFRFIASPGSDIYLLPQAVLGKHVHGEIDPHLWHDVHNAAAYVKVLRDKLVEKDPAHAEDYRANAQNYLKRLEDLDAEMTTVISSIPPERRQLVTTNDAYGYLANAYKMSVAGFVAPNPSVEPSLSDRKKLTATLRDLSIPAVFLEPQLAKARSVLKTVAAENNIQVCPLYGDTLDDRAPTYIDMMRFNAHSLAQCLGGQ